MDSNNPVKKPIRASEEPIFSTGSGLARGLGAVGNSQQSSSTSRPIGIGPNPTTSTNPGPSPVTKNSRPMGMAQSAPVANFLPPKPPSARPSVPRFEPPPFDLPPSLPNPSFLESHLANKIEEGEEEEDDEPVTNTAGAIGIQTNTNNNINDAAKKPVEKANQWGGGMARSLTNNNPFYLAMSCPNVDYASNVNQSAKPLPNQSDNKALDLGMGRSPTILSIMSGIEGQFNGATGNSSAPNPSSRASITRVPNMASSRRVETTPDEEDEDEDEVLDNNGEEEDDELQFNFTLDTNE